MAASDDLRVLVVSPFGRDAELIRAALEQAGIPVQLFHDVDGATQNFRSQPAGALLLAEEALRIHAVSLLATTLAEQPAWSDLPVLVITGRGKQSHNRRQPAGRYLPLGKITFLERPMHIVTLVSSVKAALRARSRQYERRLADEALQKSDKLAAVGRIASTIAHEINNPLEAIMNALYLLSHTSLDEKQRQYLSIASEELRRVSEIAAQTLNLNRQNDVKTQACVTDILDSLLTLYRARFASANIVVERRYESTPPLLCYPGQLRQVFANLLGNAFDAMRPGGRVIVRVRTTMHRSAAQAGVRVTVADTGSGISAAVKNSVFEAFTSSKGQQGTGLGLWVSKAIIDRHSGVIRFRSSTKPGHSGTVFSIFLPLESPCNTSDSPQDSLLQATGTE